MKQKRVLSSFLGLVLATPALAHEGNGEEVKAAKTQKTERPFSVRFGAGMRSVDIEKLLEAYARVDESITVQEIMGVVGTENIPYLVFEGAWRPSSWLELSLEVNGTGTYLFQKKEGVGADLPIEYEGNIVAYATTAWTDSLDGYYKLIINELYTRPLLRKGILTWEVQGGLGTGLGIINNRTTLSVVAEDNALISFLGGKENIEKEYGIPTEIHTSVAINAWSASLDPKIGSTVLLGPVELRLQCGYTFESAHGRARKFTRYGMTDLWHEYKQLDIDAPLNGLHAELLVGYRL